MKRFFSVSKGALEVNNKGTQSFIKKFFFFNLKLWLPLSNFIEWFHLSVSKLFKHYFNSKRGNFVYPSNALWFLKFFYLINDFPRNPIVYKLMTFFLFSRALKRKQNQIFFHFQFFFRIKYVRFNPLQK